jgi:FAD/FMN-containing dehydrogenase
MTRDQVLGIEAVLGTGSTVQRLGGLVKDNTGYHLPSLLCGSEGTLGLVTAARLRLIAPRPERVTALVAFASYAAAVRAVASWRNALPELEAAELVTGPTLELVRSVGSLPSPFSRPVAVAVLAEAASTSDPTEALGAAIDGGGGVVDVVVASDPARRRALWRYREEITPALNTLGVPHKLDVTLPASALAEFLAEVPDRVAAVAPGAATWLFGHLADGNIHVNVTGVDPSDVLVDEAVLTFVVEHGGSISAEHGIGRLKARWLALDRGAGEIEMMRRVRRALDPDGILNPGVLVPVE